MREAPGSPTRPHRPSPSPDTADTRRATARQPSQLRDRTVSFLMPRQRATRGHGTFEDVAGYRIGRGRDHRDAHHGQPPQPGPQPYAQPSPHPAPPAPHPQWRPAGHDEPEYLTGAPAPTAPTGGPPMAPHAPGRAPDPYANHPGHTQQFRIDEVPDQGYGYPDQGYPPDGQPAQPAGPRLTWKQLLSGIVLRPNATFWQMRDYTVWGPAITVSFLYGLLAVFGFDEAREDVLSATLSSAIPFVLSTGVAVVLCGLMLGAVTHTLARQFGGNGLWGPTIGLSMLISWITDVPRLVFAMFMGGDATFVQVLGWGTCVAAGVLLTLMVSRSHELPWPRALGAASVQLVALLTLLKLGTL